ncbi:MAG TPA: hypothetical protein VNH84_02800, partial [Candidatus Saccharimonadales bacterium]|nr:hypothetical protein [Candidatus Saccharimonadales bacterium]
YRELDRLVNRRARQVFDRRRMVAEDLLTAAQQKQPHGSELMATTALGRRSASVARRVVE